ncbi:hypothetical protein HID58_092371 [Brassica napus]|uniref:Uncharacterized protein n=1 Tax=Brassica napus TaxID=3708 RepID=A0ABQ7WWT6_BRANA|nr:hypothetical protein HID58_092371 [Brassica napus]
MEIGPSLGRRGVPSLYTTPFLLFLRAAVEAHRSRFSSSIDNAMEASLKIPPCPLSMSLGGAVVEGRLTLRKMESRS